ncbi:MAG TPA: large conductance mechanosensitive channel protein MscL [Hyphomicrobiales bacterium]|nr:large conductance mechanosensitive channel protein MscL [Hyphomicrobiales bacterium]
MLEEFKKFALRGSVVDLAIGVIIGAAFNRIVTSLVEDIIMPIIGFITGGLDFSNYFLQLAGVHASNYADAKKAGATIGYGNFITIAINFIIIAFILFLIIRGINAMWRKEEAKPEPAAEPRDVQLLQEIRNILAEQRRPA